MDLKLRELPENDTFFSRCALYRRAVRFFGNKLLPNLELSSVVDELARFTAPQQWDEEMKSSAQRLHITEFARKYIPQSRWLEVQDLQIWWNGTGCFRALKTMEKENSADWKHFYGTMGQQQAISWKLLSEWLDGAYHSQDLAAAAREAIESFRPGKRVHQQSCIHPRVFPFPEVAQLEQSIYQNNLATLYNSEFMDMYPEELFFDEEADRNQAMYFELKDLWRRGACTEAICQAISHQIYHVHNLMGDGVVQGAGLSSHAPAALLRGPCLWLDETDLDGYPVYLWSVSKRATIETKTLTDRNVQYACVSHTWGRWKKATTTTLDGCLWEIPENSIFEIRQLPEELAMLGARIGLDHIWFDLVCIPQVRDGELGKIARKEISRQAAIFKGSSTCVAWLNYVDDWKGEICIANWLAFQYLCLGTSQKYYNTAEHRERLRRECEMVQSKMIPHASHAKYFGASNSHDIDQRTPWFSSLWTLQETCLCPHMILMSRTWEPLQDIASKHITLQMLVSLAAAVNTLIREKPTAYHPSIQREFLPENASEVYPAPARRLTELFAWSSLPTGQSSCRTMIIVQGNSRYCGARRAEAIMSAVNVMDWFESDNQPEHDLVMGIYPVRFVEEAARKFGPEFALAKRLDIASPKTSQGYFSGEERGSLLPFTKKRSSPILITMWPVEAGEYQWHRVFDSWKFLPSGSVRMEKAVIVGVKTSNHVKAVGNVPGCVYWQSEPGESKVEPFLLEEWLSKQPGEFCTYAIMISMTLGLILQGFSLDLESSRMPLPLIKVGCFYLNVNFRTQYRYVVELPAECVDWIVL
ncbi:hypothetical protein PENNAL_c0032G05070 [Penicillium nalgiovense]|uniref:Heterokaryon incompatibility domain-containing protein n=1 Tax=Penicillium nalgiovense TaxID=60175 RepID=A0A1V6Y7Y7_PENNA|nr:hypothetical protein PENNAL_c0032G05070 [Penicillium nalgiovense]